MIFSKHPLSFVEQAELLLKRGLIADKQELISYLSKINYYKLSAYWKIFQNDDESFKENTYFIKICGRYKFDALLRNILMEAIASIETSLKTTFANILSKEIDPFFYTQKKNFRYLKDTPFELLQTKISDEYSRSKEIFVKHFKNTYGDSHSLPPAWIIIEIISFGTFAKMFNGLSDSDSKILATHFDIRHKILKSWLWTINEVRNICAHHSRLWNIELGNKPRIPKIGLLANRKNKRIFFVICIFLWLDTNNIVKSEWFLRLKRLIKDYNEIPLISMGFPDDWETVFDNIIKQRKAD